MDYPLSFGASAQGGFTGNPMPGMTSLNGTPTSGMFQGINGMNPMALQMMMKALQGGAGQLGQQGMIRPQFQQSRQQPAMIGPGVQAMNPLAAGLGRFRA